MFLNNFFCLNGSEAKEVGLITARISQEQDATDNSKMLARLATYSVTVYGL